MISTEQQGLITGLQSELIETLLISNSENVLLFSENLVLLEIFFQMGMPNIFISSIPFTVSISNE